MDFIQTHLLQIAVPLGIVAVLGAALKALPKLLEAKVLAALEYLFEKGDAADDKWLIATIVWAEEKYGAGTGKVKAEAVVAKVISLLPVQYRLFMSDKAKAKAVELFQSCFDRVEAVALKQIEGHKA